MELKTIISELKDLESGLLTEEHLEAITVARQIVERVDEGKIQEIVQENHSHTETIDNVRDIVKAITDHIKRELLGLNKNEKSLDK